MASALGVVLALILALLALARSTVGRRFLPAGGTPSIKILGSSHLGSRKQIMLVAVAGEVLILGTTAADIVLLGHVTDPQQVNSLLSRSSSIVPSSVIPAGRSDSSQEAAPASR
jgi:flagellar biogenesis protein FliO